MEGRTYERWQGMTEPALMTDLIENQESVEHGGEKSIGGERTRERAPLSETTREKRDGTRAATEFHPDVKTRGKIPLDAGSNTS